MSEALRVAADRHARVLEAAAIGLEKDGLGLHPIAGHVATLRDMAGSMRADAARGKVSYAYAHGMASDVMHAASDETLPAAVRAQWGL